MKNSNIEEIIRSLENKISSEKELLESQTKLHKEDISLYKTSLENIKEEHLELMTRFGNLLEQYVSIVKKKRVKAERNIFRTEMLTESCGLPEISESSVKFNYGIVVGAIRDLNSELKKKVYPILSPDEISAISVIMNLEKKGSEKNNARGFLGYYRVGGIFLSKLIQVSYDAGYNDFEFNFRIGNKFDYFGYGLEGKEDEPLRVKIKGSLGDFCGRYSKNLIMKSDSFRDYTGIDTENSKFEAKTFFDYTGEDSKNSSFKAEKFGDHTGEWSKGSRFEAIKSFGDYTGKASKKSRFEGTTFGDNCGSGSAKSLFEGEVFGKNLGNRSDGTVFRKISDLKMTNR